jgi:putative ABC transport system permease protein
VGSVKSGHADVDAQQIYLPMSAEPMSDVGLLVATTGNSSALLGTIKGQVWNLDPKLPLKEVATLESRVAETLARPRFNLALLSIFAGVGLLLAAIGIYGVVSYSVGQRTQEIGVRMALGAMPADVRRTVLGEAFMIAAVGTVLGVAGALALGRYMRSMVYEVSPSDPLTLAAVAVVLCGSALLAAWMPARRAMRVDPMVALREG